jgi:hypothetical protein
MTFSRKRYWLAMVAMLAIAAAVVTLCLRLHPAHTWLWAMAMMVVCGGLGFLAYFSRDEIERQNRMRAWYYGGALGIFLGVVPFSLIVSNTMLETMAGLLPNHSPDALHAPKLYFSLGILVAILGQVIGNYLARIVLRLRS